VQLVAQQKGLSHPVLDATVALGDRRLDANRKQAAAAPRRPPPSGRRAKSVASSGRVGLTLR
jgi:hypothetical protein